MAFNENPAEIVTLGGGFTGALRAEQGHLTATDPTGQGHVPPYSDDAERGILACILLAAESGGTSNPNHHTMISKLSQRDFATEQAREVWAAIACLNIDHRLPTTANVISWLQSKRRLEAAGGRNAVAELPDAAACPGLFDEFLVDVKRHTRLRELLSIGSKITTLATHGAMDDQARMAAVIDEMGRLKDTVASVDGSAVESLSADFAKSVIAAGDLATLDIQPRLFLLDPFFRHADLGFIHGPRGLGKTWFALLVACSIAGGRCPVPFFTSPKRNPVLYIDGEMQLADIRARTMSLGGASNPLLFILNHEQLFEKTGAVLNLADPRQQEAITRLCTDERIRVLVIDNLSCLVSGVEENSADDWERILGWLLTLRRAGIAVVVVAHSGRNGNLRGTSRREDAASWVVRLDESQTHTGPGAKFTATFTKNRHATEDKCPTLDWSFQTGTDGKASIACRRLDDLEQLRQCLTDGFTRNGDIAEVLGWSKGKVSKVARKAQEAGWLVVSGRDYTIK